jgi:signal transduction histidine kinase
MLSFNISRNKKNIRPKPAFRYASTSLIFLALLNLFAFIMMVFAPHQPWPERRYLFISAFLFLVSFIVALYAVWHFARLGFLNRAAEAQNTNERQKAGQERLRLEAQLRDAQKLEALGTLAGGVAHEINNPVNGILNYSQLIIERLADRDREVAEIAGEIIHEAERITLIVRNLLQFTRHEKPRYSPARIVDIVESTISLMRTISKRDQITLDIEVPVGLPKVKCRSQQIQQVLMNLLTNARDALNEKYPGYHRDKIIAVRAGLMEKDGRPWIRTTVEDKGTGIPSDIQPRIFEPFFTTKPGDKGSGLGLAVSLGIVKEHGGELQVETQPGQFTRVHLDLLIDNDWELESDGEVLVEGEELWPES